MRRLYPGPIQRVVVEGRYLDIDIGGGATDGIAARAVVSGKLQRRNGFELQIAVEDGRAAIGFAVNDRPVSGYSITWGPRLTVAVPRHAEVYVRTTTGDVLVTGIGGRAGMVVVQDSAADVRRIPRRHYAVRRPGRAPHRHPRWCPVAPGLGRRDALETPLTR